jgi:hypothetical protein
MSHICTYDESSNIRKRWNHMIGVSDDLLAHVWFLCTTTFAHVPFI